MLLLLLFDGSEMMPWFGDSVVLVLARPVFV